MADELLAAIAADPEDDEARLVWADRVGGERGELVVLQCRLAKGLAAGTRAERIAMRKRERSLIPWNGLPHPADGLGDIEGLKLVKYRRGFIKGIRLERRMLTPHGAELFETLPLLKELVLEELFFTINGFIMPYAEESRDLDLADLSRGLATLPAGRLKQFGASAALSETGDYTDAGLVHHFGDELVEHLVKSDACAQLEAIEVSDGAFSLGSIAKLATLPLQAARLSAVWGAAGWIELLRALPTLRRLAPVSSDLRGEDLVAFLAAPEVRQLRGLDLWANHLTDEDLVRIASSPTLANLESLGLGVATWGAHGVEAICGSTHLTKLRDLDLWEHVNRTVAPFLGAKAFTLDTLRLGYPDDASTAAMVQHGTLETVRMSLGPHDLEALRAAIPDVGSRHRW